MDLGNKEYLQIKLHSIFNLYVLYTKEYTFVGYQSAISEIRDIKQQYLTFFYWTSSNVRNDHCKSRQAAFDTSLLFSDVTAYFWTHSRSSYYLSL